MSQTDDKILQKAMAGDRLAFRQLVLDNSRAMFRLAWRLTSDETLAEDVVQESFVKAWKKLPEFRGQASFRSWLHRITVNTAMDHLRKQARRQRFEQEDQEQLALETAGERDRTEEQIDISRETQAAMKSLSDTERAALMLRHFEGHSINEIAQILELSSGACKQTIFRAVRKMRIALQPLVTTL